MTSPDFDYNQIQLYYKHIYPSGKVRYIPTEKIYTYDLIDPEYTYIIYKPSPGCIRTIPIRATITPDYAAILAALYRTQDEAEKILNEVNKFIPNRELTKEEQEAWSKLSDRHLVFNGISMHDLIDKLIDFLKEKVKKEISENRGD